MTRPKSERQIIGTLLGRVFHIDYYLSKGMLYGKHSIPCSGSVEIAPNG